MIDPLAIPFEIGAIDAFHVTSADHHYWQSYRLENRRETERFVLKPGWRTVYGRQVETCLVKVTLRDGQTGWGEATEPICPEVVGQLATQLIGPLTKGVVFTSVEAFRDFAYDLNRGRGHLSGYQLLPIAALDIALCDALAKTAGKPLASLFGAQPSHSLPIYLSGIRRNTLADRAALLSRLVSEGLTAAKIFVDADTEVTLAEVEGLRQRVPGDWSLMVDALWSYEQPQAAARLARRLADFGVEWLECPLIPEDIEAHRTLRKSGGVPVALGETFFTAYQLKDWLRADALDIFQPDIGRTGFAGGLQQARMVSETGLAITPHMGTGSPIVQSAALHFHAAACRHLPCEFQSDLAGLLPEIFKSGWRIREGRAEMPQMPGLGVDVDEDALPRHVLAHHCYEAGRAARAGGGLA